jgi:hypothetical protein
MRATSRNNGDAAAFKAFKPVAFSVTFDGSTSGEAGTAAG